MRKRITDKFITDIVKYFDSHYPRHKGELSVARHNDMITLNLKGTVRSTSLADLQYTYGLEDMTDNGILWLNISDLLHHLVGLYEDKVDNMTVRELLDLYYGNVIIYEKADTDGEYKDLYKGTKGNVPVELLAKKVGIYGAKRLDWLDIEIRE